MAFSKINCVELSKMNAFTSNLTVATLYTGVAENTSGGGVYGCYLEMDERDDKYLFFVTNTGTDAGTLTIKAGNSIQATRDLVSKPIAKNNYVAFMIDSGHFKWVTPNKEGTTGYIDKDKTISHGSSTITEKGKVFFTSDKDSLCICAFKMPV